MKIGTSDDNDLKHELMDIDNVWAIHAQTPPCLWILSISIFCVPFPVSHLRDHEALNLPLKNAKLLLTRWLLTDE